MEITRVALLVDGNEPRKWKMVVSQERREAEHAELLRRTKQVGCRTQEERPAFGRKRSTFLMSQERRMRKCLWKQ